MGNPSSTGDESSYNGRDLYLFSSCTASAQNTYTLSNKISFSISTSYGSISNQFIKYIYINGSSYFVYQQYSDTSTHYLSNGISYKISGNDEYIYFSSLYSDLRYSEPSDPYTLSVSTYGSTQLYKLDQIRWNGPSGDQYIIYSTYDSTISTHLWIPNPVEYVTSTDRNAYTENNTSINVNNSYNYSSSTSFPYNPTYRFIG